MSDFVSQPERVGGLIIPTGPFAHLRQAERSGSVQEIRAHQEGGKVVDEAGTGKNTVNVRDLLSLLYATKARLENEHFFCSLSYDDQAWALDLLDEMVPQLMELEQNCSFALLDQINLRSSNLKAGLDQVRYYLDHAGNQPAFFRATEDFLSLLNEILTPVRGPCLP